MRYYILLLSISILAPLALAQDRPLLLEINTLTRPPDYDWPLLAQGRETVKLGPNARLMVGNGSLTIKAHRLEIADGAQILAFDQPAPKGKSGTNQTDKDGKPPENNGLDAGQVLIEVDELIGNLRVDLRGQEGGRGGDGYEGDKGPDGVWGKVGRQCDDILWGLIKYDCRDVNGWISRAGSGQPGGNAGLGGKAGKGGGLTIKVKDVLQGHITLQVASGKPGGPGTPGEGGDGGRENGQIAGAHGSPGQPAQDGAPNDHGRIEFLSLVDSKAQRDDLLAQIRTLETGLRERVIELQGRDSELWNYANYKSWLGDHNERPWSLFDPLKYGGNSSAEEQAFDTLLRDPTLTGHDIQLLQNIRSEYIAFTFHNERANAARRAAQNLSTEKSQRETNLQALSDWSNAVSIPFEEGKERVFGTP